MLVVLLWICGCYVLTAAAVHVASKVSRKSKREATHYMLLAGNEQHKMEWYIRSIRRFSRKAGRDVRVTVLDGGSFDETMNIVRCFARDGMDVSVGQVLSEADAGGGGSKRESGREADRAYERHAEGLSVSGEAAGKRGELMPDNGDARAAVDARAAGMDGRAYGSVHELTEAVVVDLRNPADLHKLPL